MSFDSPEMTLVLTIHVGFGSNEPDYDSSPAHYHKLYRDILLDILHDRFPDGFTILEGIGFFRSQQEPCANVVIISQPGASNEERNELVKRVCLAAQSYARLANQVDVWVTSREESIIDLRLNRVLFNE